MLRRFALDLVLHKFGFTRVARIAMLTWFLSSCHILLSIGTLTLCTTYRLVEHKYIPRLNFSPIMALAL